ncbi:MAG: hypothetical protein H5T62_18640 [Anaerolineae bacterium]|nr:hypothetical protein [Anaerolineae bacterium]
MYRRGIAVVGIVILLLGLSSLACSFSGRVDVEGPPRPAETATERPGPGKPPAPTATPLVEPTPVPEISETSEVEEPTPVATESGETETERPTPDENQDPLEVAEIPELEVPTLDPRASGLGHLGTFRQRMTVSFTEQGSGYSGVYHYNADVNTAQQAVHITVSAEGSAMQQLPSNQAQAIWIGDRLWIKVGKQPWIPVPESVSEIQFEEQMFSVGVFLPYVPYFQRVEPDEVVNGILSAHYTYDAQDLPAQYGTMSGHGHIYVALDGGYVVRYTFDGQGTFDEYFQGTGTLSLVYDTYDVGAEINIQPPGR